MENFVRHQGRKSFKAAWAHGRSISNPDRRAPAPLDPEWRARRRPWALLPSWSGTGFGRGSDLRRGVAEAEAGVALVALAVAAAELCGKNPSRSLCSWERGSVTRKRFGPLVPAKRLPGASIFFIVIVGADFLYFSSHILVLNLKFKKHRFLALRLGLLCVQPGSGEDEL
jgi:hypothetical protein